MQNINEAIDAFLKNFNYVYKSGKKKYTRKGISSISSLLFNKPLTRALEQNAAKLIDSLEDLRESTLSDTEKFNSFKHFIEVSINLARTARRDCSPIKHESRLVYLNFNHQDRHIYQYDYRKPYNAGKFEKNMLKGLNAASKHLENDRLRYANSLILYIKGHKPEAEYTNQCLAKIDNL